MGIFRRKRPGGDGATDERLDETGLPGGTTGTFIDSFENMPGAQNQPFGERPGADDDEEAPAT